MARFLIVTWDGGGNVAPAFAIAQALLGAEHEVVIAGQELAERPDAVLAGGHMTLQERCEVRGFRFTPLERSSAVWGDGTGAADRGGDDGLSSTPG